MGYVGDQSWSSPILIYNVSMVVCGVSVIIMPFLTNYWLLGAASAIFGLFISANYALTSVIVVELVSLESFSKAYGLLLLIQGLANLIGPPLVGKHQLTFIPFLWKYLFVVSTFHLQSCYFCSHPQHVGKHTEMCSIGNSTVLLISTALKVFYGVCSSCKTWTDRLVSPATN